MNFEELMRHANDNKSNAIRQQKKSGRGQKDGSAVSSSAVQAFLKKKEEEKKMQQAEAESARRARIQARLDSDLATKSTKKAGSKPTNEQNSQTVKQPSRQIENTREVSSHVGQIPKRTRTHHRKSQHELNLNPGKSKGKHDRSGGSGKKQSDQESTPLTKPGHKASSSTIHSSTVSKNNSKSKKPPAKPVDFKELLAIAEQNRSGGRIRKVVQRAETKESSLPSKKQQVDIIPDRKDTKQSLKRGRTETKRESAPVASSSKQKRTKEKNDEKSVRREPASKGVSSRAIMSEVQKLKRPAAERPWQQGPIPRRLPGPPPMRRQYPESDDEGDFDDFIDDDYEDDGFIDDGADEGDVSAHIREIFGYDKRKYRDQDFDDKTMVTSYSQLEREEARSSKIAKLEDEIEFLKEQADLKRQKEALMKKSKKSRK